MACHLHHETLHCDLKGAEVDTTWQFRGIPYATISQRFQSPEQISEVNSDHLDCTRFGPRCPQPVIDPRHLLRIPVDIPLPNETEDEFKCLNLNVVTPAGVSLASGLPVLIWIHGGSQVVTFASAASAICDTTRIVKDAAESGHPIIVVSLNYRLNIFAFGNGRGEKNLALQDQREAISWVKRHIAGFGGDPDNITLAGESAGAVYCHAHVVTKAPVKRAILSSGSLYLSPPLPNTPGLALLQKIQSHLKSLGSETMDSAPAGLLVQALIDLRINSMWLQDTPELQDWKNELGHAQDLLIGDVEYESVIWAAGIGSTDACTICRAFDQQQFDSRDLKQLYGILQEREMSCRTGALDFMTDWKFALPVQSLYDQWRRSGRKAYRYLMDQANPWQPSNRANHAIDLVLLFGGIPLPSTSAEKVGKEMRQRWIQFINGVQPWDPERCFAFGPHGQAAEIGQAELESRRRVKQMEALKRVEPATLNNVFSTLAAGKISLLN